MFDEPTITKLLSMKLNGMAEALEEQKRSAQTATLSFDDRLSMLVERQWLWKNNRAVATRLRFARLRQDACLENINYRHNRGLQRNVIEHLAGGDWLKYGQNCIITGPTGIGKSYLACAMAQKACRDGYKALYYRAPKLFRALSTGQLDGSFPSLLKKLAATHLLVIDDFGLEKASASHYRDLLEVLDDRHSRFSTLITSQFSPDNWHALIGEDTVADAILDRLIHGAHHIKLSGKSLRDPVHKQPCNNKDDRDQNE